MEIPDIAPITQFSEFFKLPSGLILIVILLSGYLTVRIAQRRNAIVKENMDYIDSIFLYSITGMTWFIRFALIGFWLNGIFQQPEIVQESKGIAFGYLFLLIVMMILSSSIDVNAILCRRLVIKELKKTYKYRWVNQFNEWFERNRYRMVIVITIFSAFFLSFGFLYYTPLGIEFLLFALFYFFMMLMCTVPMISLLFWIANNLYYPSSNQE